jgi:O-antigen/teichoic acid export membrane protein
VIVSQRLVAINAASSLVARVLNVTVLLWMYQYLLKRISPEEFAVYPVLVALMAFAPLFFSVFTGGVSRHIVEAYALGQPRRVAEITSSILPLLGAASATFLLVGLVCAVFVQDILTIAPGMEDDAQLMLALLVVNYALQMLMLPFSTGFHVQQRFVELNIIGVLRDLLRIALLVTLLVGVGPSVLWVVVAGVIAEQAHLAAVLVRSRQLVPEARFDWELFHWATARELVSFGLWTTVGQLANMMVTSAATLILNGFGTALDVTVYHLGATFYRQILSVIGLAAQPLQPALTAMHSLADGARLARTTLRGGRYGLWVALLVACPLAIYSREFVQLYLGAGYAEAAIVLSLFMVIFIFGQPTTLLPMIAMATARVRAFNLGAIIFAFVGLLLTFYLVASQGLGAVGATLSLVVVAAASQLFYFWPLQLRLTGAGRREFATAVLLRGTLPAIVASGVWALFGTLFPPKTWLSLVVLGAIGAVAYLVTLLSFCLDDNERKTVNSMVGRIVG